MTELLQERWGDRIDWRLAFEGLRISAEKFQRVVHDATARIDMWQNGTRYCVLSDHSVLRHPDMKPLLHNGGKPR